MPVAYHQRDWRWGIIVGNSGTFASSDFQDTTLVSTASTQIPINNGVEVKKNVTQRVPNRANGYRQETKLDSTQDDKGISPTFNWNSEATKASVDFLFSGLFQRCVEGNTNPFVKRFKWPTSTAVWSSTTFGYPAFASGQGYFYGFVGENPTASAFDEGILSAVPTDATFSIVPNGLLSFTSNWMGRLTQEGVSYTAPTAYTAPSQYSFEDMSVRIFSTAVVCYGWSLTITPGFTQLPSGGEGCTDISMSPHKVTGYVDILWDSVTRSIFADLDDDGSGSQDGLIEIFWGTGANPVTTDGDLAFFINAQFNDVENQGTEERIVRLTFKAIQDVAGSVSDIEIQIANAIDRSWQS